MTLTVNGIEVGAQWENNAAVQELFSLAEKGPVTVNSTLYGGFEQVGGLPRRFSSSDVQMATEPGDIVLYSGDQLVLFFGTNSWNYTKLGHMDLSVDELTALLGGNSAVIKIEIS